VAQEGAAWISTPSGARRHSDYDAYERKTYELGPYQDKQNSNKEQTNKQTKKTNKKRNNISPALAELPGARQLDNAKLIVHRAADDAPAQSSGTLAALSPPPPPSPPRLGIANAKNPTALEQDKEIRKTVRQKLRRGHESG
jgi:hypothetical protein